MQPNSGHHKYYSFICHFESGKCEKEVKKKLQNLKYISQE